MSSFLSDDHWKKNLFHFLIVDFLREQKTIVRRDENKIKQHSLTLNKCLENSLVPLVTADKDRSAACFECETESDMTFPIRIMANKPIVVTTTLKKRRNIESVT